jgi:hypothetical protein
MPLAEVRAFLRLGDTGVARLHVERSMELKNPRSMLGLGRDH